MAILDLYGKTKYTTLSFNVIPDFILNDIKKNTIKNTYKSKNIVYEVKKNKDSYVILKKDLSYIFKLKDEIVKQKKQLLKQRESMKLVYEKPLALQMVLL